MGVAWGDDGRFTLSSILSRRGRGGLKGRGFRGRGPPIVPFRKGDTDGNGDGERPFDFAGAPLKEQTTGSALLWREPGCPGLDSRQVVELVGARPRNSRTSSAGLKVARRSGDEELGW